MSNEKHETVADIVAQIRAVAYVQIAESPRAVLSFADRIEAAHRRFYNELNRQILVLKREKEMSDMYSYGYDPEEALVAQCSTCRFFKRKHSHCTLNDSLTNARYKCSGWKFKTNKECADEYKASHNHEVAELRAENARLRAALKPVLEVALSYEDGELINRDDGEVCTDSEYAVSVNGKPIDDHTLAGCLAAVREAQGIYDGSKESEVK